MFGVFFVWVLTTVLFCVDAFKQEMICGLSKRYSISQSFPPRTAKDFFSPKQIKVNKFTLNQDAVGDPQRHEPFASSLPENSLFAFTDKYFFRIRFKSVHTDLTFIVTTHLWVETINHSFTYRLSRTVSHCDGYSWFLCWTVKNLNDFTLKSNRNKVKYSGMNI